MLQGSGSGVGIGIAVGVGIGLALVIWCYCQGCYCFGGSTEIVVEEYGTSKGLDVEVVRILRIISKASRSFSWFGLTEGLHQNSEPV